MKTCLPAGRLRLENLKGIFNAIMLTIIKTKFFSRYLPLLLAVLLLGVFGFLVWKNFQKPPATQTPQNSNFSSQTSPANLSNSDPVAYVHPDLGFSFNYPGDFKTASLYDDAGETVLIQKDGSGFQIYIRALEEETEITPQKISQDIPDMVVDNPFNIDIKGVQALVFDSKSEAGDKTGEIWFTKDGNLYQITATLNYAPMLLEILKSWQWQ